MGEYDFLKGAADDLGVRYEDQMFAYLSVAACNQKQLKTIKEFWIANNVDGIGAWDDIVVYTETAKEKELYFLQLKHKKDPDSKISISSKDFQKYALSWEQISSLMFFNAVPTKNQYKVKEILTKKEIPFQNVKLLFVTNAKFNENSYPMNMSKDETTESHWVRANNYLENTIFMTNSKGSIYKLSSNMTGENAYDINFINKFIIVSEQSGVPNKLKKGIKSQLKMFISDKDFKYHKKVAKYLPKALKQWRTLNKRTLFAADVQEVINSGILFTLKVSRPINNAYLQLDKNEWDVFKKLTEPYQLVVISDINLILKNFFNDNNSHYFISCENCKFDFVIDCLKIAKKVKVILYIKIKELESISTQIKTLYLLNSLDEEMFAYLNNYSVLIQGRKTNFGLLLKQHSDIKNIFTVDDIIKLLLKKLNIGENRHSFDYYVPRTLERIFVKKSIFRIPDSYFNIILENNLVVPITEINKNLQLIGNNSLLNKPNFQCVKCDADGTAKFNIIENEFKSTHILKYHHTKEGFQLEWLSSTSNIEEIMRFIEKEKFSDEQIAGNFPDLCLNTTKKILIVGNPGMGKTYFAKNLANEYFANSWVILVILHEINLKNLDNFQSYLNNYSEKNQNFKDKQIFKLYLDTKSVFVLFDGFDEIAPDHEEKCLQLIHEALGQELKIVVTSRKVTKDLLQRNLNVFPYMINPFSYEDKINFLGQFYSKNIGKRENSGVADNKIIRKFASKLLEKCQISNWDEEFTGVPLQCQLLAEGFLEYCQNYCEKGEESALPNNLNLITLYDNFVKSKFKIHVEEKGKLEGTTYFQDSQIDMLNKEFLNKHMTAAVETIFPHLEIRITDEFMAEIKQAKDKYGIITGLDEGNKAVFIHRTFAEYFTAKWLVNIKKGNKEGEYLKFLLDSENNVIHDLFDKIICKECNLHNAVLNVDVKTVKEILNKNENRDDGICRRNALHIIAARGARHERIEKENRRGEKYWEIERKEEEKYLEILDCLLENCDWVEEKDDVLRWTPQQYLDDRNAFGIIDRLCGFKRNKLYNLHTSFMTKWNRDEMLEMCSKYDYINIETNIVDLTETKDLLERCANNDAARFADQLIQSKELNSQYLTSIICSLDYEGEGTLLHLAAFRGNVKILDIFLKYIDVNIKNTKGQTPLHIGSSQGHLSVVEALVKNKADLFLLDDDGQTPMDMAIDNYNRNTKLVEYVTSYDTLKIGFGEEINAKLPGRYGRSALHYAAMGKNMSSLKRLRLKGANVNITDNEKNTALHEITDNRFFNESIASRLIEYGLNINAQNNYAQTALHFATRGENKECMEFLLQHEANPNIVDNENRTALHLCAWKGSKQCMELLLRNGATATVFDYEKRTALHLAARRGNADCVAILLQYKANPNMSDNKQQTALHLAALYGNKECIELLLQFGADINMVDNERQTALYWAAYRRHSECVKLLNRRNEERR